MRRRGISVGCCASMWFSFFLWHSSFHVLCLIYSRLASLSSAVASSWQEASSSRTILSLTAVSSAPPAIDAGFLLCLSFRKSLYGPLERPRRNDTTGEEFLTSGSRP